jgi:hypothetical protein
MADGNLLNPITADLGGARANATVRLKLAFSFGAQKMLEEGSRALLVVYDLEQYKAHQGTLAGGGETGEEFFRGTKNEFDFPPDHQVAPGTGVLLMARVKFKSRPLANFTQSFVEEFSDVEVITAPACKLALECFSSTNEQGQPLPTEAVDSRVIITTGPAAEDFKAFTALGGSERQLTVRLLKLDLSAVLVSQLNPKHSSTRPIRIRYESELPHPVPGTPAKAPEDAPPPKPTRMPFDLTGEYVQLRNRNDNPDNAVELVTPAVLRVHHIGRAVCAWYSPIPTNILNAREPSTQSTPGGRLFDPPFSTLTPERMVLVLGKAVPGTADTFFAEGVLDSGELDPDALLAVDDEGNRVIAADRREALRLKLLDLEDTPGGKVFRRIQLSRAPSNSDLIGEQEVFAFRRISANSRLAFDTFNQLLADSGLSPEQVNAARDQISREFVEPIPPGVIARLISAITSPQMEALVAAISFSDQPSERIFPAEQVAKALANLADQLKSITGAAQLDPQLVTKVRNAARGHNFLVDGAQANMLEALERISNEIVESKLAEDPQHKRGDVPLFLEESMAELALTERYRGFAEFNIRPGRDILYKFEFSPLRETKSGNFVILSGTVGAFSVTISKLDRVTRNNRDDNFPPTVFVGAFLAGAVGAGIQFKKDTSGGSAKKAAGATIDLVDAEVVSFSDLQLTDFDGCDFSIFATGAKVSLSSDAPIGVTAKSLDAVFSLTTVSVPPVTLEIEIKKAFDLDIKTIKVSEIIDYLKKLVDAKKAGKPKTIVAFEAALTAASLSKGFLKLPPFVGASPRADEPDQTAEQLSPRELEFNVRVRGARFRRQSAALEDEGRQMLELKLAVLRKVLEYPGWMDIEGTSSPEWDNATREQAAQKNIDLSRRRAAATRSAIFAAAGDPGQGPIALEKDIRIQGKGAEPFKERFSDTPSAPDPNTGEQEVHLDPFSTPPPLGQEPARTQHQQAIENDKASFYPTLRRVDVIMNGVFVVRIPTK